MLGQFGMNGFDQMGEIESKWFWMELENLFMESGEMVDRILYSLFRD